MSAAVVNVLIWVEKVVEFGHSGPVLSPEDQFLQNSGTVVLPSCVGFCSMCLIGNFGV